MGYDNGQPRRPKAGHGRLKRSNSDNPKAPVLKGGVTIKGVEYWASAWRAKDGDGLDLSFEEKTEARRDNYERNRDAQAPQYDDRNPPPRRDEW